MMSEKGMEKGGRSLSIFLVSLREQELSGSKSQDITTNAYSIAQAQYPI